MKRLAALLVATGVLASVGPAFAGPGGTPPEGTCGLGKDLAQEAIQDQTGPGASEAATVPPNLCKGHG